LNVAFGLEPVEETAEMTPCGEHRGWSTASSKLTEVVLDVAVCRRVRVVAREERSEIVLGRGDGPRREISGSEMERKGLEYHWSSFADSGALDTTFDDAVCLKSVKSSDNLAVTKGD